MPEPSGNSATLCAIMKNEGPYILEWVAFHKVIGFDKIVIYSNDSEDDSDETLSGLAALGEITFVRWPNRPNVAPQMAAYNHAVRRVATEWLCFLDADEFLNLKQAGCIQNFLAGFAPDVAAIAINWRIFGSAGQQTAGPGLVIERFTKAARQQHPLNRLCKSLSRVSAIERVHVHRCYLRSGRYVNELGQTIAIDGNRMTPDIQHAHAQINHYSIKSKEEYRIKAARGYGLLPLEQKDKFAVYTEQNFVSYDLNDEEDTSILRFEALTRAEAAALRRRLALLAARMPPGAGALQVHTLVEAASGLSVTVDAAGAPVVASAPADAVMLYAAPDARAALVALPTLQVCRAAQDGSLAADRQHVMAHETCAVLPAESGQVRLRSHWGGFWRVGPDGRLGAAATKAAEASGFTLAEPTPAAAERATAMRLRSLGCQLLGQHLFYAGHPLAPFDAQAQAQLAASRSVVIRIGPEATVTAPDGEAAAGLARLFGTWLLACDRRCFIVGPGVEPDIAAASVDFIHLDGVVQRLGQQGQIALLADAFRTLRAGGILRLTVPSLQEAMRAAKFARGAAGLPPDPWRNGAQLLPSAAMLQDYAATIGFDRCCRALRDVSLSPHFTRDTQPDDASDARFSYLFFELIK